MGSSLSLSDYPYATHSASSRAPFPLGSSALERSDCGGKAQLRTDLIAA